MFSANQSDRCVRSLPSHSRVRVYDLYLFFVPSPTQPGTRVLVCSRLGRCPNEKVVYYRYIGMYTYHVERIESNRNSESTSCLICFFCISLIFVRLSRTTLQRIHSSIQCNLKKETTLLILAYSARAFSNIDSRHRAELAQNILPVPTILAEYTHTGCLRAPV